MIGRKVFILIILVLFTAYCYNCLKVIPERTLVKYVNEIYLSNVTATVRRASRRGEYVFNLKLMNKKVAGNNVTFRLIVYEYNSKYNQYVRTLIELNFKWCDLILHDKLIGPIVRKAGITQCPSPVGPIMASNMTFDGYFPFDISFQKGMVESSWRVGPANEIMCTIETFVSFTK